MGVWDATTPTGSAPVSEGDDRIREIKVAVAEALSHELSTFPGASPSTTPIFIPGFLKGVTAARPTGDSLVEGRFYCNETLNILERYSGSAWVPIGTVIPAGTKMVFFQAAVPTGWTQVTNYNDYALRVVSGTGGGTGGAAAFSGLGTHTHTGPSHDHEINYSNVTGSLTPSAQQSISAQTKGAAMTYPNAGSSSYRILYNDTIVAGTGATGASSVNFYYLDVVLGTKD